MKLTYWVAEIVSDHAAYNVRGKTRKQVLERLAGRSNVNEYSEPHKVTIEYRDAFDLMEQLLAEGGHDVERDWS